jgi:hypothetical protein
VAPRRRASQARAKRQSRFTVGTDTASVDAASSSVISFDSGDVLFGTYRGSLLPTPTTDSDGRLIMTAPTATPGGTGRLTNAFGHGRSIGTVDTTTGQAVVSVSGTL